MSGVYHLLLLSLHVVMFIYVPGKLYFYLNSVEDC